ncbi:hypothetical protein TNCV_552261 [Trichonephila clavipes]|nr:hypothetical protein TNCV_552261 [Trichonephila clavipes]
MKKTAVNHNAVDKGLRQSDDVLLLKAEIAACTSMKKTTFEETRLADSNWVITSQITRSCHRSRWRSFPQLLSSHNQKIHPVPAPFASGSQYGGYDFGFVTEWLAKALRLNSLIADIVRSEDLGSPVFTVTNSWPACRGLESRSRRSAAV